MTVSGKLLVPKGVELFIHRCDPKAITVITTDEDYLVLNACEKTGSEPIIMQANYTKHPKRFIKERDRELLKAVDEVAVFWDGVQTRGQWLISKCITYHVNCLIFNELGTPQKFIEWAEPAKVQ